MGRMLDLIRVSAVSQHQMMSAARGALPVPPVEMLEILIYLAEHNKIHGEHARLTLAGWDETCAKQLAADPDTPKDILEYWLSPKNIRPALFELLLENPSVPVSKLCEVGSTLKGELIDVMMASRRVRGSMQVLNDIATNHNLTGVQSARVQALIKGPTGEGAGSEPNPADSQIPASPEAASSEFSTEANLPPADPETEKVVSAFLTEHASEIAAEGHKPFQPIGGIYEDVHSEPAEVPATAPAIASPSVTTPTAISAGAAATAAQPALAKPSPHKAHVNPKDEQRGSVLQKIAKLDITGRIQLAMKGTKEERSILVRDGTKLVALAVLDSPKISDGEVEKIASQRNVLEAVLRAIPLKRRFMKNYAVVRNLVCNPRTPLDIGLGLMKNLLAADLKNLSGNKEVSDTIRKLALRMFKQKSESGNKN